MSFTLSLTIAALMTLGLIVFSCSYSSYMPIAVAYPDQSLSEAGYLPAKGFPVPMRFTNAPEISGVGSAETRWVWHRVAINACVYALSFGIFLFLIRLPRKSLLA